jgi:hypothetical protein
LRTLKAIALLLPCVFCHCCFGALPTNTITTGHDQKAEKLAPLPLKLPAPSLGNNGPFDPETGPQIEPFSLHQRPPFLAPVGVTNLALKKTVTASVTNTITGTLSQITDGQKEALDGQVVEMRNGVQWVQIDLEQPRSIHAILIWHDGRSHVPVFRGVVVQAADDAGFTTNVRTLFNNDYEQGQGTDKRYFETHEGKLIDTKGMKARYLRFYSNGSNSSPLNCYTEIEVWGLP